ncbi:MAG: hypothetical protein ACI9ZT_000669, partial [Gammaproteobacteria bacterium]
MYFLFAKKQQINRLKQEIVRKYEAVTVLEVSSELR